MFFHKKKIRAPQGPREIPQSLPFAENIKKAADLIDADIPDRPKAQLMTMALARVEIDLAPELPGFFVPGKPTWLIGMRGSGITETARSLAFRALMSGRPVLRSFAEGKNMAIEFVSSVEDHPTNRGDFPKWTTSPKPPRHSDPGPYVFGPDDEPAPRPMMILHNDLSLTQSPEEAEARNERMLRNVEKASPHAELLILSLTRRNDPVIEFGRRMAAAGKLVVLVTLEPEWGLWDVKEGENAYVGKHHQTLYRDGRHLDLPALKPGELYAIPAWLSFRDKGVLKGPYVEHFRNPIMASSARHAIRRIEGILRERKPMTRTEKLEAVARAAGFSSWMAAAGRVRKTGTAA